jgi:hypothetical protein
MPTQRRYIPEIGKIVKLEQWMDYSAHGIPHWAWLKVLDISGTAVTVEVLNGDQPTGKQVTVPLHTIEKPVGWEPRYTITVKPAEVDKVLGWFKRGIVCRLSHDLNPHYMPMVFQPMDNSGQPSWKFPEITDSVPPEECDKVFRVVKIEEEVIDFVPIPACARCHGTGRRNISTVAEARRVPVDLLRQELANSPDSFFSNYDPESGLFDCTCRAGGFIAIGTKGRRPLIEQWAKDGWKVEYNKQLRQWERFRKTVVKDWTE